MKKIMLLSILLLLGVFYSFAQNSHKERAEKYLKSKGELTFTFLVENNEEVAKFTKNLSLENIVSRISEQRSTRMDKRNGSKSTRFTTT